VGEIFQRGGRSQVISVGNAYLIHPHVVSLGGWEYVHSINAFDSPVMWPDLPSFSRVDVQTNRATAGVDWKPYDPMSAYFRYVLLLDDDDVSNEFNSGTAQMFLTGLTWIH
jgi:hypothetical protein